MNVGRRLCALLLATGIVVVAVVLVEPGRVGQSCRLAWRWARGRALSRSVLELTPVAPPPLQGAERVYSELGGADRGWAVVAGAGRAGPSGPPTPGDLVLTSPAPVGGYAGVAVRLRSPPGVKVPLEFQLGGRAPARFPRVRLEALVHPGPPGTAEAWVPLTAMDPDGARFERLSVRVTDPARAATVQVEEVLLAPPWPARLPVRQGAFSIDCRATAAPISPRIYGIAGFADDPPYVWRLGASARRWGGELASRYNWELGNAWNLANDWFFQNAKMSVHPVAYRTFLEQNREHGAESAVVVPMLGWVAKDTSSYSFPVSRFGAQQAVAPERPDSGNGLRPDGSPIPPNPPAVTSVPSTPESVGRWVAAIRQIAGLRVQYILDNEPMSWAGVHRDVHPTPVGYEELLARTLAYAAAVRRADPEGEIAGPAEAAWVNYFYSARDLRSFVHWDRLAHGGVPLIPWYLRGIRAQERRTGLRLLDVLDVHHYSSAPGVGVGPSGGTDPATAALRLRQTRTFWDGTYVDESWYDEPLAVLPTLRRWIAEDHPGLEISIGEWSFGAEGHMSGGLATAETLGRFGTEGVSSAFYWTYPPDGSPGFWAFRAYRNFDGAGGRFLDWSAPVKGEVPLASLFASRDEGKSHVVAVLLNLDPRAPLDARISLAGCASSAALRAFSYRGGPEGLVRVDATLAADDVQVVVEPYSFTVLDLR